MSFIITESCIGCGACVKICPSRAVTGEKKKLHTIDTDLCIQCRACGTVCPTGSVEDHFGRVIQRVKPSRRQHPLFDRNSCMACTICVEACPTGAICLDAPSSKDPHAYPVLGNEKRCIACGFCERECPVGAITMAAPVEILEP